jgi:hypothetical protein
MKKGNVIHPESYQDELDDDTVDEKNPANNELEEAIQALIRRMREFGPVPN